MERFCLILGAVWVTVTFQSAGVRAEDCKDAFAQWIEARQNYAAQSRIVLSTHLDPDWSGEFSELHTPANCPVLVAASNELLPRAKALVPLLTNAMKVCGEALVPPAATPLQLQQRLEHNLAACSQIDSGGSTSGTEPPAKARTDVYQKVRNIVSQHMGIEIGKVNRPARFSEDLQADCLDLVEVSMAVEEEFGMAIESGAGILTVGDMVDLVTGNVPEAGRLRDQKKDMDSFCR